MERIFNHDGFGVLAEGAYFFNFCCYGPLARELGVAQCG